ncbi:hypothetical protein DBY21_00550 [Candidatus Gastranaerophilales bacterium]|nr:MAG: hypothetical protein DBY21_00550 [Candidatus Gastranaerophilales bacterium]
MKELKNLTLKCMAIGSLPHTEKKQALSLIEKNFQEIPFWPQLVKLNKNEDMIFQFLEKMPSFFCENDKIFLDIEYDAFFEDFEEFFNDYEEIISTPASAKLEKYKITRACAFDDYIDLLKRTKPGYAKGQIVGPFTLASSLCTKNGLAAVYDETLREIILKTLTIKALWQVQHMKLASPDITPIIFIDEPSISQLGTSAYVGISKSEVISMLSEITDILKENGAIPALHCCGKCDWTLPIDAGVEIINPDAFSFAENLSLFSTKLDKFLQNGGKIAWGIVPTLDKKALEKITLSDLEQKFHNAIKYLTKKGIDEKLVIENSMITPSCGAGVLTVELAEKAMDLTKELSIRLKEIYKIDD